MKVIYVKQGKAAPQEAYKPIGVWAFDGQSLDHAFLPGHEDAEVEARKALGRAQQRYGEKIAVKHLHYIMRTANSYTTCFTLPVEADYPSARACVEAILRTVAERVGR